MLDPVTGQLQTNTLPIVGGVRQLTLNLNGGDAALFKFANGAPFVGWGPPISISSPANSAIIPAPANVFVSAVGADNDRPLSKVEFFVGDAKIGQDATAPFGITWSNAVEGFYTLTAIGTDTRGNTATSAPVSISLQTGLVHGGSVWKYLDDGSNQGTAWRNPAFNDNAWASGPAQLGYGDGDEATLVSYGPDMNNKYITTYFRRTFAVSDISVFTNLLLRLMRDDGAVVYLNGIEVFRSNLPGGTIAYNTLASASADESVAFYSATLSTNQLINGANLLAVEVHQSATNSSDLSFDLELIGRGPVAPPVLSIQRRGDNAVLFWSALTSGLHLESASTLPPIDDWSDVTGSVVTTNGQNQVAIALSGPATFFRLHRP
jgi:hypothetical protein